MDRIQMLLAKARMGDLSPDERRELQEAMKGVAPASPEFSQMADALNRTAPPGLLVGSPEPAREMPVGEDAVPFNTAGNTPNMRQPTMDWASGIGDFAKDALDHATLPFGLGLDVSQSSAPDLSWERDDNGNTEPNRSYTDIGPLSPVSSTANVDYERYRNHDIAGPTLAGGYGSEVPIGDDDIADVGAVTFPGGYSFSDSNETAIDLFSQNPDLFNRNLTENVLDQKGMEPFWENRTRAAMQMATYGLLGNGNGRSDLGGGPTTSTGQLAATEDFMKQFAQPGVQTVDPGQVYRQIFDRAVDTDWSKQMSRQGNGPMGPEEQVDTTNMALLTSMGFSNPETEAWMTSLLENAKMEYMMYLAQGGDPSISYPKFLDETMDFSQLI